MRCAFQDWWNAHWSGVSHRVCVQAADEKPNSSFSLSVSLELVSVRPHRGGRDSIYVFMKAAPAMQPCAGAGHSFSLSARESRGVAGIERSWPSVRRRSHQGGFLTPLSAHFTKCAPLYTHIKATKVLFLCKSPVLAAVKLPNLPQNIHLAVRFVSSLIVWALLHRLSAS